MLADPSIPLELAIRVAEPAAASMMGMMSGLAGLRVSTVPCSLLAPYVQHIQLLLLTRWASLLDTCLVACVRVLVVQVVGRSLLVMLARFACCKLPPVVRRVLGVRCCSPVVAVRLVLHVVVRLVTVVVGAPLRSTGLCLCPCQAASSCLTGSADLSS